MPCLFAYITNSCGCLIGYRVPLKTANGVGITAYPVNVLNVNGSDLGEANSASEYVSIWNSDAANQVKGILSEGPTPFCFMISKINGVTPPSYVLGELQEISFKYGFTDLDTTGAVPSEADYVDSVNAESTGTVLHGQNVVVNNFGNTSDKVLWVQVPPGEAPFLFWSEQGNPLQRLQPIDDLWLTSTREGDTIYFTRFQTSFTGHIIFSR